MMSAYDWIGIVIESIEVRVVDPRMLNEFKLARDVGVEANLHPFQDLSLSTIWISLHTLGKARVKFINLALSQNTMPKYSPGATSRISSLIQCATSDVWE